MKNSRIRIYPFIDVTISPSIGIKYDPIDWYRIIRLTTRLRKRDPADGRVFSWIHTQWHRIYELDYQDHNKLQDNLAELLARFNSEIYKTMLFGKVNVNLIDGEGDPLFVPDYDQCDEEFRMRHLFPF